MMTPHESSFNSGPLGDTALRPEAKGSQNFLSLLSSTLASDNMDSKSETLGSSGGNGNRMVGYLTSVTGLGSKQDLGSVENRVDSIDNLKPETSMVKERPERVRRGSGGSVVDECCLQACTFATLESYCAAADEPVQELSMVRF